MRSSLDLQKALYEALTYADLVVYDEVPDEADAPYVVIGETTEQPDDTHDEVGTSETVLLHFWSRAKGASEVKGMMGKADVALHARTLDLDGGERLFGTRSLSEIFTEEAETGEVWRHGVMRVRYRTAS